MHAKSFALRFDIKQDKLTWNVNSHIVLLEAPGQPALS